MDEKILQALKKEGWNLEKANNGLYHTRYHGQNAELIVHLNTTNLEKSIILAIAYLPIKVMQSQNNKVAQFLNQLNLKTFFGSFELNYTTGEIAFRTGIFYFNTDLQMPMIVNCLDAAAYAADMDYPSILEKVGDN
ncbi:MULTISPECIES: YbjN domain-containing protein [unclassified Nostoc]|uniref:YbjN domain-containing protein n=1 Tax=unclassified Nostoc TaxID=2593658 RepID=UPI001DF2A06B|nr:YbjN domain-containing protein [Nostoc sp. JL23]MBN3875994.1 YbjN domain-containing protein [Nostoc sp. JL23]